MGSKAASLAALTAVIANRVLPQPSNRCRASSGDGAVTPAAAAGDPSTQQQDSAAGRISKAKSSRKRRTEEAELQPHPPAKKGRASIPAPAAPEAGPAAEDVRRSSRQPVLTKTVSESAQQEQKEQQRLSKGAFSMHKPARKQAAAVDGQPDHHHQQQQRAEGSRLLALKRKVQGERQTAAAAEEPKGGRQQQQQRAKGKQPAARKAQGGRQTAVAAEEPEGGQQQQRGAGKKAASAKPTNPAGATAVYRPAERQHQQSAARNAASSKAKPKLQQQQTAAAAKHLDLDLAALQAKAAGPTGAGNPAAAAAAPGSQARQGLHRVQHPALTAPDVRVEAAMMSSGIGRLKSRPGRVYAKDEKIDIPDVSVYQLGDQTGHHAKLFVWAPESGESASTDAAKAKAAGDPDIEARWVQVTISCHDCQHQHVKWLCPNPAHKVSKKSMYWSYCNRCLVHRYAGTKLTVADLHESCPQCRGCCTCKACLGKPHHEGQVEVRLAGPEQQRRDGAYLRQSLAPHVQDWLQQQTAEALAGGYLELSDVPASALLAQDRAYCDRCATNLIGLSANCPACEKDVCVDCMRQLREHEMIHQQDQEQEGQQQQQEEEEEEGDGQPADQQQQEQHSLSQRGVRRSKAGTGSNSNSAAAGPSLSSRGSAAAAAAAAAAAGGVRGSSAFVWHCWNPHCGSEQQAERADAAEKGRQQDVQQQQDQQQQSQPPQPQQQQQEEPVLSGGKCWMRPDGAALRLQFVLPQDLVPEGGHVSKQKHQQEALAVVLGKLQEVAQTRAKQLTIEDCPLLPAGFQLQLLGVDGQPLTLQQLEGDAWWELLEQPCRDKWRRHAGWGGADKYVFTPSFEDLQIPEPPAAAAAAAAGPSRTGSSNAAESLQADYQAQLERCGLALVLFWARWRRGEPIVVRGCKGRIPWDPHTMWRATKDAVQKQDRVLALDCSDFHVLPGITPAAFFSGYSSGIFEDRKNLVIGPIQPGRVVIAPETAKAAAAAAADGETAPAAAATAAGAGGSGSDAPGSNGSGSHSGRRGAGKHGTAAAAVASGGKATAAAAAAAPGPDDALTGPKMMKVKDWPPTDDFGREMPRHYMDFVERMPVRGMTNPRLGWASQNLASMLLFEDNPTDLGPKCYLAYGRQREADAEGDSVTKLHKDMTDAINILVEQEAGGDSDSRQLLLQTQQSAAAAAAADADALAKGAKQSWGLMAEAPSAVRCGDAKVEKPGYNAAGAVWDIWPRGDDTAQLSRWLAGNAADFVHLGKPVKAQYGPDAVEAHAPIMSQSFMLLHRHKDKMQQETGVTPWHFEQHVDEGVYIPGGCPHQVRNLMSCSKVAVDFVSAEAVASALQQRGHLRVMDLAKGALEVGPQDRDSAEKLQSHLLLLRGALTAHGMTATPQVLLQPQAEDSLKAKLKPSKANPKRPSNGRKQAAAAAAAGKA